MSVRNIYYFVRNDKENKNDIGFFKKFYGQIAAFRREGNVHFIHFRDRAVVVEYFEFNSDVEPELKIIRRFRSKLAAQLLFYYEILKFIGTNRVDVLYFRYKISEPVFLRFLSAVRKKNPDSLLFSEFPTFPYDENWKQESMLKKIFLPVDRFFRKFLKHYVNFAVTYYDAESIYGIETIRISNAVDVHSVELKRKNEPDDAFIIIGVAGLGFWHGYDRIIKGIAEYNRKAPSLEAFFYIVGDGREKNNLECLADQLNVNDYVLFFGPLTGDKLDELFDKSHIGVNTIGWHRMGVTGNDTLKAREYCARGLPFITSGHDHDFGDDFKYVFRVGEDDTPVDVGKVIDYYEVINNSDFSSIMRDVAVKKLSWYSQMGKVIEKFGDL